MNASSDAVPRDYNFAADILKRNLDAGRGDKAAYIDHRGSYTYAELAARVERFGHVLRALGIRREERILICLLDTIDWPTAFLGAIKAGVVAVPVNTLLTEDDYRFMLEDSGRGCWSCPRSCCRNSPKAIEPARPRPRHRLRRRRKRSPAVRRPDGKRQRPTRSPRRPTRDDMCFWLYTSGSTGGRKAPCTPTPI
jgi:benzoate-CoA ligase